MIRILLIHNSEIANATYKKKLIEKYPILENYSENWSITVIKPGKTIPKSARKNYDRVYYDTDTLTVPEITEYINVAGNPQVFGVNLQPKTNQPRNRINLIKKVTKLNTENEE